MRMISKDQGFCVAIFEWDDSSLTGLVLKLIKALRELGLEFSSVAVGVPGLSRKEKISVAQIGSTLLSIPEICSFECDLLPSGALLATQKLEARSLVVYGDSLGELAAIELTKLLIRDWSVSYGFVFDYISGSGDPILYSLGVTEGYPSTCEEMDLADQDSRWFSERLPLKGTPPRMRHTKGMLRDVFPTNILNGYHLGSAIEGKSLEVWIRESPERGDLEKVSGQNWLWRIQSSNLSPVRDSLIVANLLISRPSDLRMTGSGLSS